MIEAAYRFDGDEDDWLRDLLAVMLPAFDHGLGAFAYTYDLNNPARPISFPVSLGAPDYVDLADQGLGEVV
jgi:hypothetical protein